MASTDELSAAAAPTKNSLLRPVPVSDSDDSLHDAAISTVESVKASNKLAATMHVEDLHQNLHISHHIHQTAMVCGDMAALTLWRTLVMFTRAASPPAFTRTAVYSSLQVNPGGRDSLSVHLPLCSSLLWIHRKRSSIERYNSVSRNRLERNEMFSIRASVATTAATADAKVRRAAWPW